MTSESDEIGAHGHRPERASNKPILTARRPGIEKMLGDLPITPEERNEVRSWALALTAAASAWQVDKCKRNALGRGRP